MASVETVDLNAPHPPHQNAVEAFNQVLVVIKAEIIKSRHHWNKHEPRMWDRSRGVSDKDLVDFNIEKHLVEIRSGPTSYGTIIFGKIKLPAITDGYVHVRIHDPPNRGPEDVMFHSIFTYEGRDKDGHPDLWRAIHTKEVLLEFFNE